MQHSSPLLVGTIACACGGGDGHVTDAGGGVPAVDFPAFALGVEYTSPGLGPVYGATGVRWAKTWLEAFSWGAIEPSAPSGNIHTYSWTNTDAMIRDYQSAGVTHIQSYLGSSSPWGSRSSRDAMPKPERMADYRAWVRALIERYDGDGIDDMPGLVEPVRYWVVGGEWSGFWGSDNPQDYLELLDATREEARSASADTKLGAIPFLLIDVFQGNDPTAAEVEQRLVDPPPGFRNSTAGMRAILDRPDLFDFVDVHSLGDYTELPPLLTWFRAQMTARGYAKPIWIDDAFPMSFLANYHPSPNVGWPAMYPVTEQTYPEVYDLLVDVAKLQEPAYTPAARWIRAETASGLVKKVVTALGEGAVGIQIGNTEDWMHDALGGARHLTVNLIGAAAMMGLVDVTHAGGYAPGDMRIAGPPRPAYDNLRLLVEKFGDGRFDNIERIETAGVRGYRFVRGSVSSWVIWHEDDVLQLPPAVETPVAVTLPVPDGVASVTVTHALTEPGSALIETVAAESGSIPLELTSTPVFIE